MPDATSEFDFTYDCDDFGSLYRAALKDLQRLGISSPSDYSVYRQLHDHFPDYPGLMRIEWGFANAARCLLEKFPALIGDSAGISLLVEGAMQTLTSRQKKKALVLAKTTTLFASPVFVDDCDARGDDNASINVRLGPDIEGCLRLAYEHHVDTLSNAIIPIPQAVPLVDGQTYSVPLLPPWTGGEGVLPPDGTPATRETYEDFCLAKEKARFDRWKLQAGLPSNVFYISLDGYPIGENGQLLKLGIVLPSFDRVPIATVRQVRCDHAEEFLRFQRAISRLSGNFGHVHDDERRLQTALSEFAEEVNRLRTFIAGLQRAHTSLAALPSLVTVVFYLLIQDAALIPQVERVLAGLASGAETAAMFNVFRRASDIPGNLDGTPFYLPLRGARHTPRDPDVGDGNA